MSEDAVILEVGAKPSGPALVLRPWSRQDVASLVEVFRDPALRQGTSSVVDNEADAMRWVRDQEQGWAAGDRFGFAVLQAQPDSVPMSLVGHVVLKNVAPEKPSAEVGYWTAVHARGRGVAPRALDALSSWAFDILAESGLERLELLHQVDNPASCRVAHKGRYDLDAVLPPAPPLFPREGHLHVRHRDA